MEHTFESHGPEAFICALTQAPLQFAQNQQALAAQAVAMQSAWLAACAEMQMEWLSQIQDRRYLPQWMIWHNGTEELG
jgi:hypothetical protein